MAADSTRARARRRRCCRSPSCSRRWRWRRSSCRSSACGRTSAAPSMQPAGHASSRRFRCCSRSAPSARRCAWPAPAGRSARWGLALAAVPAVLLLAVAGELLAHARGGLDAGDDGPEQRPVPRLHQHDVAAASRRRALGAPPRGEHPAGAERRAGRACSAAARRRRSTRCTAPRTARSSIRSGTCSRSSASTGLGALLGPAAAALVSGFLLAKCEPVAAYKSPLRYDNRPAVSYWPRSLGYPLTAPGRRTSAGGTKTGDSRWPRAP